MIILRLAWGRRVLLVIIGLVNVVRHLQLAAALRWLAVIILPLVVISSS